MKPEYEIRPFENANKWRRWLEMNYETTDGVWIQLYKKASGIESVTYAEALDEALCYGWIDGQRKSHDDVSFLQKFTPRRKKSLWSKRNIEYVARLTDAGKMMPAGEREVERARTDGRWDAAYDKPTDMVAPDDLLTRLENHPEAKAYFATLNKTSRYHIGWQLQTAKTDATRQRRLDKIIANLEIGQV